MKELKAAHLGAVNMEGMEREKRKRTITKKGRREELDRKIAKNI